MENRKQVTIRQVAEKSGVSIGTVDRILHNRGRFSLKTKAKVDAAIKELGYKPNLYASMLSTRRSFRIVAIIPYFQSGDFWSLMYDGVKMASEELSALDVKLEFLYYYQFDEKSFADACRRCEELKPDGLILSPIHKELSSSLVKKLEQKGVPSIFLDTRVSDCPYLAYYGINLYDSAFVAADMIFHNDNANGTDKLVLFNVDRKGMPKSEAFVRRTNGFKRYVAEKHIKCELMECSMAPADFLEDIKVFDEFFGAHPEVHVAVTMTSRANLIADWAEIRKKKDLSIIGYDMTAANLMALKKGTIDCLVAHRVDLEAYEATKAMLNYLVLGQKPEFQDNLFPIDILSEYNVEYYLHPTR